MINIYFDDNQSLLKNTEVNICNFLIMAGDFNIRDSTRTLCTLFILLIVTFYSGLWTLLISFYPHLSNSSYTIF